MCLCSCCKQAADEQQLKNARVTAFSCAPGAKLKDTMVGAKIQLRKHAQGIGHSASAKKYLAAPGIPVASVALNSKDFLALNSSFNTDKADSSHPVQVKGFILSSLPHDELLLFVCAVICCCSLSASTT